MAKKPAYHSDFATRIRRDFFRLHKLTRNSLREILEQPPHVQDKVLSGISSALGRYIGVRFPKDWDEARPPVENPYFADPATTTKWAAAKLRLSADRLSEAILSQKLIEQNILLGDYNQAEIELAKHADKHGISLWAMDALFLIREQNNGFTGNRLALSNFCQAVNDPWARIMAFNSSYRTQNNVPDEEYRNYFRDMIDSLQTRDESKYASDYLTYRYLDEHPISEAAYCHVIHFESRNGLLDQYSTFLRVNSHRVRMNNRLDDNEVAAISHLSESINDPYCATLAAIASRMRISVTTDGHEELLRCIETYLQGKFRSTLETTSSLLTSSPIDFVYYDIVALSAARLGEPLPLLFQQDSLAQFLLRVLYDWYSASRPRSQVLEDLKRLSRALHSFRLGRALVDFVYMIDEHLPPLGYECAGFLSSPFPLPNAALTYSSTDCGLEYATNYSRQYGETPGTRIIEEYLHLCWEPDRKATFSHLNEKMKLRYQSAAMLRAGKFGSAVQMLSKLRQEDPNFVRMNPELFAGEASALLELGEIEEAATSLANLYCEDSKSIPPALLRRFSVLLTQKGLVVSKTNPSWPILASIAYRDNSRLINVDRVHDYVGDLIEAHGELKPTGFFASIETPDISMLRFFADCCTTDILESSLWYDCYEDVLRERLDLCSRLQGFDTLDQDNLAMEIAELTRKLAIADITSRIERSRIHVDTDKIIKTTDEKILGRIARLLMLLALKDKRLMRGVKILLLPTVEGGKVVIMDLDESLGVFEDIFSTIKRQFLNSPEWGLDANLSQSIRHGTLAGELRATFDRLKLTTRKDSTDVYQSNEFWLSQITQFGMPTTNSIDEAFASFSRHVDETIRLVRERWIQIKSDSNPDGLFDYEFTPGQLTEILETISPLGEPADVFDVIIEALWVRTEECLIAVRESLSTRLYESLSERLDVLQATIENESQWPNILNTAILRDAVTQCKTDLVRELSKIAGWFSIENHKEHNTFGLMNLIGGVEQVLNRINSRCSVQLEPGSSFPESLPGVYFRPLWDMMAILFDNAAKHSGLPTARIRVRAIFNERESQLFCTNAMDGTPPFDSLIDKAAELNRLTLANEKDLGKLRQEGGSGIAKLHKIVRHDMGRDQGYSITFNVVNECEFQVNVDFGGSILNEDPSC